MNALPCMRVHMPAPPQLSGLPAVQPMLLLLSNGIQASLVCPGLTRCTTSAWPSNGHRLFNVRRIEDKRWHVHCEMSFTCWWAMRLLPLGWVAV